MGRVPVSLRPWAVEEGRGPLVYVVCKGRAIVATLCHASADIDADHIVACVNALEGINPEKIGELMEAANLLVSDSFLDETEYVCDKSIFEAFKNALSAAKEKV